MLCSVPFHRAKNKEAPPLSFVGQTCNLENRILLCSISQAFMTHPSENDFFLSFLMAIARKSAWGDAFVREQTEALEDEGWGGAN